MQCSPTTLPQGFPKGSKVSATAGCWPSCRSPIAAATPQMHEAICRGWKDHGSNYTRQDTFQADSVMQVADNLHVPDNKDQAFSLPVSPSTSLLLPAGHLPGGHCGAQTPRGGQ